MGGSNQPYIYEPGQQRRIAYPYTPQSDFNPKAATQASYRAVEQREQRARQPKNNGPLLNFNQHPDSYMIVGSQNRDYKPMPPGTRKKVIVMRWVQFGLRICNELTALGLLVCAICLQNMPKAMSWIVRVAPAWDIVITIYAIYHLARPAKSRAPASAASYHIFAFVMDVALIPFYVYTALFSFNNWDMQIDSEDRWTSLFTTKASTTTLLFATFTIAVVLGSFHLVSTVLDIWLAVLFKKISNLPPDVNPLEDNLTSRGPRLGSHKYKNSNLTVATESLMEKDPDYMSRSTLELDQGNTRPGTAVNEITRPAPRTIPFGHSRADSNDVYSPHNLETARQSRQQFENFNVYEQSIADCGPRQTDFLSAERASPPRPGSAYYEESRSGTVRHNRPLSYAESRTGTVKSGKPRYYAQANANTARPSSAVHSQQEDGLLDDNWYAMDNDDTGDLGSPGRQRTPALVYPDQDPIFAKDVTNHDRHDSFDPVQPLSMNPPTPPPPPHTSSPSPAPLKPSHPLPAAPQASLHPSATPNAAANVNRTLTAASNATASSSVYSDDSAPMHYAAATSPNGGVSSWKFNNAAPKGKYYGNLAAATQGIRNSGSPERKQEDKPQGKERDGNGRVVSRTGADVMDGWPFGGGMRGRDVSGKVAEEGRGGGSGRGFGRAF